MHNASLKAIIWCWFSSFKYVYLISALWWVIIICSESTIKSSLKLHQWRTFNKGEKGLNDAAVFPPVILLLWEILSCYQFLHFWLKGVLIPFHYLFCYQKSFIFLLFQESLLKKFCLLSIFCTKNQIIAFFFSLWQICCKKSTFLHLQLTICLIL